MYLVHYVKRLESGRNRADRADNCYTRDVVGSEVGSSGADKGLNNDITVTRGPCDRLYQPGEPTRVISTSCAINMHDACVRAYVRACVCTCE